MENSLKNARLKILVRKSISGDKNITSNLHEDDALRKKSDTLIKTLIDSSNMSVGK